VDNAVSVTDSRITTVFAVLFEVKNNTDGLFAEFLSSQERT